jgi:hypothetical protein
MDHHSAQKTMYTGFCSAAREKIDRSASTISNCGASGPSGLTRTAVVVVVDDVVDEVAAVDVVASEELGVAAAVELVDEGSASAAGACWAAPPQAATNARAAMALRGIEVSTPPRAGFVPGIRKRR